MITLKQLDEAIPNTDDFLSIIFCFLLARRFYNFFHLIVNADRETQIEKVKKLYGMLPKINQDTLKYLIVHISK